MLLAMSMMLILPVCQTPIFSRYFQPLPGLHVVKRLPLNIAAGSTYEWEVSFVNPKSEEGWMNITLEITEEHGVGPREFSVKGTLESYDNPPRQHQYPTLTFTETSGGTFHSLQTQTEKRFNHITLRISSVPNLMPGTYTFTLTITSHTKTKA
jgi:hypothetical protein